MNPAEILQQLQGYAVAAIDVDVRDYFAAYAMMGLARDAVSHGDKWWPYILANYVYDVADAMIARREQGDA
jgi:hypothetical protein